MDDVRDALPAASPPLTASAKLAYGLGDFGFGLSWNMVGAFLLFYYTDVALLPAAAVGTLLLISRLADAAVDPVIGILVDRTRGRSGRARPWFKWGAVPFGLLCAATFWMPPAGESARLLWAVVTFGTLGILFSVVNIPYGALLPMMTNRNDERLTLGSLRAAGTAISVIVATAATMPLVSLMGGGHHAGVCTRSRPVRPAYDADDAQSPALSRAGPRRRTAASGGDLATGSCDDRQPGVEHRLSVRAAQLHPLWCSAGDHAVLRDQRAG
jgi:hypothetical protein